MAKIKLAKAWDDWMDSSDGKGCNFGTATAQILQNRLWYAFMAGAEAAEKICKSKVKP